MKFGKKKKNICSYTFVLLQVEVFRTEKRLFDQEVSKWDDNGNDVIVLAKHMCMIMMEMTDFTRGKQRFYFLLRIFKIMKNIILFILIKIIISFNRKRTFADNNGSDKRRKENF